VIAAGAAARGSGASAGAAAGADAAAIDASSGGRSLASSLRDKLTDAASPAPVSMSKEPQGTRSQLLATWILDAKHGGSDEAVAASSSTPGKGGASVPHTLLKRHGGKLTGQSAAPECCDSGAVMLGVLLVSGAPNTNGPGDNA